MRAWTLLVLRGTQIAEVVSFLDADFPAYGLPAELTETDAGDRDDFSDPAGS